MRNLVLGSYSARGKKNRRNIRRFTLSEPSTAAITNLRRRAITLPSSGSSLVKMLRNAWASEGFAFTSPASRLGGVDPGVSDVEFAILSPGRDRPGLPSVSANHRSHDTAKNNDGFG